MCKKYLDADPWLKISFCKDSTRQSVDEKVQRKLLQEYTKLDAEGLSSRGKSSYTLYNSQIIKGMKKIKGHKTLDSKLLGKDFNGYVMQKFFGVEGGHQDNVDAEVDIFLKEANKYCYKNNDIIKFFAQIDGDEGEKHIDEYYKLIENHDRIFVGNSESIIERLNSLYE